jgi:two-component system NtrC family sensor kinase
MIGHANGPTGPRPLTGRPRSHREILRRTLVHQLLFFLAPFLLLTFYFHLQALALRTQSHRRHLQSIVEYQAHMCDLFIRERAVNLANQIDDPSLANVPLREAMATILADLKRASPTFADVGLFDSTGVQVAYAGPFPVLERRDYSSEKWFVDLRRRDRDFVITDIYLGFRQRPHFTIAVSRQRQGRFTALRASLEPERMYEYITSLEGARDVQTFIVNEEGTYQLVTPNVGTPLADAAITPPREPRIGTATVRTGGRSSTYGYAWLTEADWALVAQSVAPPPSPLVLGGDWKLASLALLLFMAIVWATIRSARRQTRIEEERDSSVAQLEHAAKLASVGELAGGVAHEINNPLAIISEEAGLMKDLMDPRFGRPTTPAELVPHLDAITEAVFRCRDITRKLLGFVRQTDFRLARTRLPELVDEVVDGLLGREIALANIEIVRRYEPGLAEIVTDSNQLKQVILNLLTNAIDAIGGEGRITIGLARRDARLELSVADTGIGMTREQLGKVFLPFFTTKEVGRGTGLGLSVSYGIVKGLGGEISVRSEPGRGSTFIIALPVQ